MRERNLLLALSILVFLITQTSFAFSQSSFSKDSAKAVSVVSKNFPVESKHDYKRFLKIYHNDILFGKLLKGKDSTAVQLLLGKGIPMDSDLFLLTFQMRDPEFNNALLYKIDFTDFNVKKQEWYLAQFAVLFNLQGKAFKIFDHQTRGENLFDKRKKKSV